MGIYSIILLLVLTSFHTIASDNSTSENYQDAVHAKVATKVYFTSDFIDLQTAIYTRICEEKGDPDFWKLVKEFSSDKNITSKLSTDKLLDNNLSLKKSEIESLILVLKLIQVLVDQQVSVQNSKDISVNSQCLPKGKVASLKIKEWHNKLIFLGDLLISKANIEKDEKKKQSALKSILESLDKQIKHEILIDVK
jgi:hypothetical protein